MVDEKEEIEEMRNDVDVVLNALEVVSPFVPDLSDFN